MRRQFAERLHLEMGRNKNIFLLTGDLGYGLWDRIRLDYQDRFYNVGSSEQLMLGMAAGLAMENKIPIYININFYVFNVMFINKF